MPVLLAVTAHPDDESFLFGGALALHARRGDRVGLLCLTDGQAGRTGGLCAREELGRVRRAELGRAAAILGIPHVFTPGLMDGGLDRIPDVEGIALVKDRADAFGADVVLTFGPEGASGHADHKACWRWTRGAAANGRRLYAAAFPEGLDLPRGGTPLPATHEIDVSEVVQRKRAAFAEHRTQQDHRERFDSILAAFDGRELYHRVRPAWQPGAPAGRAL